MPGRGYLLAAAAGALAAAGSVAAGAAVTARLRELTAEQTRAAAKLDRVTARLATWEHTTASLHWLEEAVGANRDVASQRHDELLARLDEARRELATAVQRAGARAESRVRDETREVEALLQLFRDATPRAPMPPSGRWALDPTGLLELLFQARLAAAPAAPAGDAEPAGGPAGGPAGAGPVLELGSGTSTVWLGYAMAQVGGRLVSIDHDAGYADLTRRQVRRHGLDPVVDVRQAPLRPVELTDGEYQWYDPSAFTDLEEIPLLVVDGPPGATGPLARYPALPMLRSRLAADARVLLDDVGRPEEQQVLERWLAQEGRLSRDPAASDRVAVLAYLAE